MWLVDNIDTLSSDQNDAVGTHGTLEARSDSGGGRPSWNYGMEQLWNVTMPSTSIAGGVDGRQIALNGLE